VESIQRSRQSEGRKEVRSVHNAGSVTLRHRLVFSDAGGSYDASAQVLVKSYCTEQL
jgi:hypothetical protein